MNRILKSACIVAVMALAFASCKKNETKLSFVATADEIQFNDVERAYIDPSISNKPIFEQGEQVVLYNIELNENDETPHSYYGIYTARTTGQRVLFDYQSGPLVDHPIMSDAFFAFYPGQRVNNAFLAQGNYGVFDIPNVQTYREINGKGVFAERAWAMAGKKTDQTNINDEFYFNFRNIMGAMCLWLRDPNAQKVVTSIEYTDKLFHVAGDVHLKIHEIDPDEMLYLFRNYNPGNDAYMQRLNDYKRATGYFVDGNQYSMTMTLDCGDGVALNGTAKPFYMVLRPLAYYAGCTITINFADGSKKVIDTNNNRVIEPGVINNFTNVNVNNLPNP